MKLRLRLQLSAMMFFNYFVWGTWYVTVFRYVTNTLDFTATQGGLIFGTASIAAMISPFFVGMFVDRFVASEKMLGILHIIGAILMYFISEATDYNSFFILMLLYTITFMPSIALTNSICFSHMDNPDKDFPGVRVLGTIGWIVVGILVGTLAIEESNAQFQLCGVMALFMGLYSFSLPNTPPKAKGKEVTISDILGLDALSLMKKRSFGVMVISSVLVCVPLSFYYVATNDFLANVGMTNPTTKMTLGQASEIIFMLIMPLMFVRLGVKKMILIGMAAWVIRYLFFAFGDADSMIWMLYGGIILHGICYDFFFVTGQIYVDDEAPEHLKGSAQGLITFATYGLGMFIGSWLTGVVIDSYALEGAATSHDWYSVWMVPALLSFIVLIFFALMFKDSVKEGDKEAKAANTHA
ncbi:MAG: nucleoside permease [Bacteroidota bacterium]